VANWTPSYGQFGRCSGADHYGRWAGGKIKDAWGPGRHEG